MNQTVKTVLGGAAAFVIGMVVYDLIKEQRNRAEQTPEESETTTLDSSGVKSI